MRSKKRTIGILIVVIVLLLGFASSLLVYRNKLSSEKIKDSSNQEKTLKNYFYVTEEKNIVNDSIRHIKYVNNELEIVVERGTDLIEIYELAKKYNAEIVGEIEIFNTYQFKFNEIFTLNQLEEIATNIRKTSFILDVNINYVWDNLYNTYTINKGDIWKNDTWNEEAPDGKNWSIEAIQCISAWDLLNKKAINPVRIGLIDNVFDENHEDLRFAKTYYNCSHSELLKYVSENDDYEHGTNVAGVMAANSERDSHGSDIGICGVYPFGNGNLYAVSFVGASKTNIAIESYLVNLIVENNVKVINISCLGDVNLTFRASHLNEDSAKNEFKRISFPIEKKLIELIKLKYDFLICTSAGNESYGWFKENKDGEYEQIGDVWNVFGAIKTDIVDAKYGPLFASIDNEELKKRIIVVGAVEQDENHMQICSYSNGGKRVDIYAPGEKITTTSVDNKYRYYFSGTSAAAPFVSGTAAMIWSVNNNLTGEEVKEILCNTAKCPESAGSEYFKMVNAKLAVEEAIRRTDALVVPIEDETQSSESVEITEITTTNTTTVTTETTKFQTEPSKKITAIDLIDKSIPEIISLMNGEYQIIQTEMGGYYNGTYSGIFYIQNQSVFPGMEFYVETLLNEPINDFTGGEMTDDEIQSNELRKNLEDGKYALDGIQVNKSGKVSNTIQAGMDYKSCSKALGDFDCIPGNGGYIGGSVVSVSHTYNEKNAKVILHFFDIPLEIMRSLVYKGQSVSSEQMKSYNPNLRNVVIKKNDKVETVDILSLGNGCSGCIDNNGNLYMWGDNLFGKLGNGTTNDSSTPIKIMDNVKEVNLGDACSSAITNDGSLYMWGSNEHGKLGNGTTEDSSMPIKIMDNVKSVSLGSEHIAAITDDGSLYMWGSNKYGKLGNGTTNDSLTPVKIMDNVKAVSISSEYSGAITNDGSLYMWGGNWCYQLGNGTNEDSLAPIKIMDNVKSITLSSSHNAVITEDGNLYMWGYNDTGQVGNGTTNNCATPVKIMDNVKSVSLGSEHSGAITNDGSLYMWGNNFYNQLGYKTAKSSTPTKVMDNIKSISLAGSQSSAITEDNVLYMWGRETNVTVDNVLSVSIGQFSYGDNHYGVIKTDGSLYMWGDNNSGEIGNGESGAYINISSPIKIDVG